MRNKKIQASFMNIGASSLLVIFLILCIAIFATLSLSGARSDLSFSQEMAQHKTDYYNACNQSEEILDEADAILAEAAAQASGRQEYYTKASAMMERSIDGVSLTISEEDGIPTVSWQIPVDETRLLDVQLVLNWPYDTTGAGSDGFYRIEKWQTIGGGI